MTRLHPALLPLAIPLALATAPRSQNDLLYGAHSSGTALVRIDPLTLLATPVGAIGYSQVGGLAFGNDAVLYGVETNGDSLLRIDTATGAGTRIGLAGRPMTFSTGLANDPTTDLLYGIAQGGVGASSLLITLSKTTGAATLVGETGASAVVGLDVDASGQLWGIDGGGGREELIRIDKTTGARTVVAAMGLAAYANIGALCIGTSGAFWAVNARSASQMELVRIDPVTGAGTLVGLLSGVAVGVTGLAAHPCGAVASAQVARLGAPPNPPAFLAGATPPVLGWTWNPRIDHTAFFPNAFLDVVLLSPRRSNVPTAFGTLLVDPLALLLFTASPGAPFAVLFPNDCSLAGSVLPTQGVSADPLSLGLTNALDLTVGTW